MPENPHVRSLVFPFANNYILLGLKKTGLGTGKYNGFGGKFNPDDGDKSIEDTAVRELYEESIVGEAPKKRINPNRLEKMAELDFYFPYSPHLDQKVHIYFLNLKETDNKPRETKEMAPQWFLQNEIPYGGMWKSDELWLPLLLEEKKIIGTLVWKEDNETVESFKYEVVEKF